jgi:hypothetical protein
MIRLTATEHEEQAALIEWAGRMEWKYPDLHYLYAIPNGGLRNKAVAAKLKAEGVKPGCPDLCLPAPRGAFNGLYVELKAKGGSVSAVQREFLQGLKARGYCTAVCVGWDAAREVIENYLRMRTASE